MKQSFDPVWNSQIEILILGSLPGDRSLELQQYYGYPQNRFWPLMAALLDMDLPPDYPDRLKMLLDARIGLWDVAQSATRVGSMDSDIREVIPNDLNDLKANSPDLRIICFNGKKAQQLYDRFFQKLPNIQYLSLPSTSPANARKNLRDLILDWAVLLKP